MGQMFTIEGGAEIQRELDKLKPKLAQTHFRNGLRMGANVLLDEARMRAPIREDSTPKRIKTGTGVGGQRLPGFLLEDIDIRGGRSTAKSIVFKIGTSAKAYYARFSEFGTLHQPARPWLRPALDTAAREAISAVRDYFLAVFR